MAGVKGKSGRRTRYQEIQEGNLLNICTVWLVENFHTFDKESKIRVALEIAKKGIVQKLEHSGAIEGTRISINMVKVTNETGQLRDNAPAIPSVAVSNGR